MTFIMLDHHAPETKLTPDDALNIIRLNESKDFSDESLVDTIKESIDNPGYIILRGWAENTKNITDLSSRLLSLVKYIGYPVSHDQQHSFVWNIKRRFDLNQSVPTYSEHANEASLHTDSQYREKPEDAFALLSLEPAACGGGVSLLMTYESLMKELNATEHRKSLKKVLEEETFPFAVPTAFKRNPTSGREYVYAPILEKDGKLRFRSDTLRKALDDMKGDFHRQVENAYEMMVDILSSSKNIRYFFLEKGDLVFINNRTVLHGRTAFSDINRHLLRIRFNRKYLTEK